MAERLMVPITPVCCPFCGVRDALYIATSGPCFCYACNTTFDPVAAVGWASPAAAWAPAVAALGENSRRLLGEMG